jgi:hypothetical protein
MSFQTFVMTVAYEWPMTVDADETKSQNKREKSNRLRRLHRHRLHVNLQWWILRSSRCSVGLIQARVSWGFMAHLILGRHSYASPGPPPHLTPCGQPTTSRPREGALGEALDVLLKSRRPWTPCNPPEIRA